MYFLTNLNVIITVLWLIFYIHLARAAPQATDKAATIPDPLLKGLYIPELHGAARGKYVPDESGKYRHIVVPYDGGYGDRGQIYVHDERGLPLPPPPRRANGRGGLKLGPKDHLRFAIDFNYDDSGWQIVQFEWVNDDDETMRYDYKFENQLWATEDGESDASNDEQSAGEAGGGDASAYAANPAVDNTNVHVSGEYQGDIYNVNYSNDNTINTPSQSNIQTSIREVLQYIQTNVLPKLK